MKLFISQIFKSNVKSRDDKVIGKVVNVIVDMESLEARLLLFPEIKSGSWLWDIIQSGESLLYPVTEGLGIYDDGVIVSSVDRLGQRLHEKQLDREELSQQTYMLVPVSEIRHILGNDIVFEEASAEYKNYINMPVSDVDLAFYHDGAFQDPKRAFGISLNLTALRGIALRDPNNRKGRIIDLQFDVIEGLVNELVVRTPGKGILGRRINASEINFQDLTCLNAIRSYPPLQRVR